MLLSGSTRIDRSSTGTIALSAAVEDVSVVHARDVSETHRVRERFQPSVFVRAVCSVPLLLLVALLIWGGATTGGLAGWLAWGGALAVLVAFGRGWIIRVEDLGDRIRVVNWMQNRRGVMVRR